MKTGGVSGGEVVLEIDLAELGAKDGESVAS